MEEQFILRLPPKLAHALSTAVGRKHNTRNNFIEINYVPVYGERAFSLKLKIPGYDRHVYAAMLYDLPTRVETHKTWDNGEVMYKVADVAQVLKVEPTEHSFLSDDAFPEIEQYTLDDGLSPHAQNIAKTRHRWAKEAKIPMMMGDDGSGCGSGSGSGSGSGDGSPHKNSPSSKKNKNKSEWDSDSDSDDEYKVDPDMPFDPHLVRKTELLLYKMILDDRNHGSEEEDDNEDGECYEEIDERIIKYERHMADWGEEQTTEWLDVNVGIMTDQVIARAMIRAKLGGTWANQAQDDTVVVSRDNQEPGVASTVPGADGKNGNIQQQPAASVDILLANNNTGRDGTNGSIDSFTPIAQLEEFEYNGDFFSNDVGGGMIVDDEEEGGMNIDMDFMMSMPEEGEGSSSTMLGDAELQLVDSSSASPLPSSSNGEEVEAEDSMEEEDLDDMEFDDEEDEEEEEATNVEMAGHDVPLEMEAADLDDLDDLDNLDEMDWDEDDDEDDEDDEDDKKVEQLEGQQEGQPEVENKELSEKKMELSRKVKKLQDVTNSIETMKLNIERTDNKTMKGKLQKKLAKAEKKKTTLEGKIQGLEKAVANLNSTCL